MDAVKFIKERNRMCATYEECTHGCPLEGNNCYALDHVNEYTVSAVEKWSAAHPIKTRQSIFLEHYPNADLDVDGVLKVCPKVVEGSSYINSRNCGCVPCAVCHKVYWLQEVK